VSERSGFLDTTIHVSRQIGAAHVKQRIEQELPSYGRVGATTFSKVEFKNAVIRDVDFALRKLNEAGSLWSLLKELANLPPQARSRINRILLILGNIEKFEGGAGATDDERLTDAVRTHLENAILGYWFTLEKHLSEMHEVKDGTGCLRAGQAPREISLGKFDLFLQPCKKSGAHCRMASFFLENRHLFVRIRQAVLSLPPADRGDKTELGGFERVIEVCLRDPSELCSSSNCKKLADAIIAVESEDYSEIYTSNYKDFAILCQALNRRLNRLNLSKED